MITPPTPSYPLTSSLLQTMNNRRLRRPSASYKIHIKQLYLAEKLFSRRESNCAIDVIQHVELTNTTHLGSFRRYLHCQAETATQTPTQAINHSYALLNFGSHN